MSAPNEQHTKHKRSVEVARGLLLEWRAKLGQVLGEEGDVVRGLMEQGLKDTEALVDKVRACWKGEEASRRPNIITISSTYSCLCTPCPNN